MEGKSIQQDTISVYADLSCRLRHGARKSADSRLLMRVLEPNHDNMCLTPYVTAPDAKGMEHPAGAILDNIGAYFEKDKASTDAQAYINHIIDNVGVLAFVDGCTPDASAK